MIPTEMVIDKCLDELPDILISPPLSPTLPVLPSTLPSTAFFTPQAYRKYSVLFNRKTIAKPTKTVMLDSLLKTIKEQKQPTPDYHQPYSSFLSKQDHSDPNIMNNPLLSKERAQYHQLAHRAVLSNIPTFLAQSLESHQKASEQFDARVSLLRLEGKPREVLNVRLSALPVPENVPVLQHVSSVCQRGAVPILETTKSTKVHITRLASTKSVCQGDCKH
jgi:hypothetical protein